MVLIETKFNEFYLPGQNIPFPKLATLNTSAAALIIVKSEKVTTF